MVGTLFMETNYSQLVSYKAPNGTISIDVTVQNDTIWLNQGQMAELFGKDQSVISRHISNAFKEGELEKESNMQILHNTLSKFKPTQVYRLDVIISVGYRVKSKRGNQFRIWANQVLKQYLLQGYAINERVAAEKYDELKIEHTTGKEAFHATYENAMDVIREFHEKFGGSTLFGNEKDDGLEISAA